MNENVKKFLNELGIEKEVIENLAMEKLPEDFKIKDAAKSFFNKRKDLTLNDSELKKELKKEANLNARLIVDKQIKSSIKSMFGVTEEEINSLVQEGAEFADVKDVMKLAAEKAKTSGNDTVEEVKKQLFEVRNKYDNALESHKQEIEKITSKFQGEKKNMEVKSFFSKEIGKLSTILPQEAANKLLSTDLMNQYNFDIVENKLEVFTKDGTKVDDGKNFLSADEVIKRRADELGILQKSNARTTDKTEEKKTGVPTASSEDSDAYKDMLERIKNNK